MYKLVTLLWLVLTIYIGQAQTTFSINDKLTQTALENVHVYIKQHKTTKIFVSGENGEVISNLQIKKGDEIKVTHIGYETLYITVGEVKYNVS